MLIYLAALIPYICQPVVNIYNEPSTDFAPCSQAIYGTTLEILSEKDEFAWVQTEDQESGWIKRSDYIWREQAPLEKIARVDSLKAHIYKENDLRLHAPILSLPYGSKVELVHDTETRWVQIRLLNDQLGWMQKNELDRDYKVKNLDEMIALAHRFLERPYTWGGFSSEGLDCSGLTKICFKESGFCLPHSAKRQSEMGELVCLENIAKGDLLFFGEKAVQHVAIYLGDSKFIHACARAPLRPSVRIEDFSEAWKKTFITARRFSF